MQIIGGPEKTLDSPVQPAKPAILRIPISEIGRIQSIALEKTGFTCSLLIPFSPLKDHEFSYQEAKDYTAKYDKTTGELFITGCTLSQLLSDSTWNNLNKEAELLLIQRKEFNESKVQLLQSLNSNPDIRENSVFTRLKKELKEADDCHTFSQNISLNQWITLADLMVDFHDKKATFTQAVLNQKLSDMNILLQKLNIKCDDLNSESVQVAKTWKQVKNPAANPQGSPIELIFSKANTFVNTESNLLNKSMKGDSRGKLCVFKSIKKKFAGDSKKAVLAEYHFPVEIHFFDTEKRGDEGGNRRKSSLNATPIPPMPNPQVGIAGSKN
jgi:hypothetical protein